MAKFIYTGPQTSFSVGDADYCLLNGETVELDPSNAYVQRLKAIGRLTPITEAPTTEALPTEAVEAAQEQGSRANSKKNSH
jgi:hypothetical protein